MDWETLTPLTALTHLDGRNSRKLSSLRPYFSEYAWIKLRMGIMASFACAMAGLLTGKKVPAKDRKKLDAVVASFSLPEAEEITRIETRVNHDVKAIELFLIENLKRLGLVRYIRFVNLGIGSEDINSIALGLVLLQSREEVLVPAIKRVADALRTLVQQEKNTLMIGRTHAKPANVTTFGKELANPLSRLCDELAIFRSVALAAKCSGEVGSFQAFTGVDTSIDWLTFTDSFVRSFSLLPSRAATQIAPYDSVNRYLHSLWLINSILVDFVKNMWLYVLLGYVKIKTIDREVGSAGMPHKVNPIYFEGAEGGFEMANGVIETLVRKLSLNRLQRDFSDSTVRRNIVLPIAYSILSYQSIEEGLTRTEVDRKVIAHDLRTHPEVWLETIKAYGTVHGTIGMYERLKKQTRGKVLSHDDLRQLVADLPLTAKQKQTLTALCDGKSNPYPARMVEEVLS